MESLRTFEQILFDISLGIYTDISINFSSIKARVKFYLKLQDEYDDRQIDVDVTGLETLYLHKHNHYSFIPDKVYKQIGDNEFTDITVV